MQTDVEQVGDITVVAVNAEQLDASNAEDLRQAMTPILANSRKLVLDLSRVNFVDSRGCGAILSCLKSVAAQGGDLKLCQVTPTVRSVFEMIRLHRICEIHATRADAVRSFQGTK
jgi:anti-sigma B factor antagonist